MGLTLSDYKVRPYRNHLRKGHVFKKDKNSFKKNEIARREIDIPYPTGDEIWETVQHIPTVYEGTPHGPSYEKPIGFRETHNWVKRSIFWELPYWRHLLIRHNLDVMHIEKNVFDNLSHTIMGTPKSKDKLPARQDMEKQCDRTILNPIEDSRGNTWIKKGEYTLERENIKKVCVWLKKLKFPDRYASNIGNCVNVKTCNFYGFKSHDCHVFMQRLLPLDIRGFVPNMVYESITELCMFFRVLCSKTLLMKDLYDMKHNIAQTICKLEKIFPPGFFDSMEHLIIHLADEAILGGPVHHRWMYQYERKLGIIKRRIRNKSRVEGSIVNEHLVHELSTYCSLYFSPTIETPHNREPRNFALQHDNSSSGEPTLSVFSFPSRRLYEKVGRQRGLSPGELHKAHTYILPNCAEVSPYIPEFDEVAQHEHPNESVTGLRDEYFARWFEYKVHSSGESVKHLEPLARGPLKDAMSHKGYFVNGYKFHTREYGTGHATNNYGLCVRGEVNNGEDSDYYGLLDEILEIEYYITKETKDLWVVVKTKPRGVYELTEAENEVVDVGTIEAVGLFQVDERFEVPNEVNVSERLCLASNATELELISDDESEGSGAEDHEDGIYEDDMRTIVRNFNFVIMSDKEIACNLFSGGPPSGSRQLSDRSGRSLSAGRGPPRNTLTSGSVPRGGVPGGGVPGRVSPDLPSVPFPGGSRTSPPSFTGGYSGSSSMGAINPNSGKADPLADMAGILWNMGTVVTPYNSGEDSLQVDPNEEERIREEIRDSLEILENHTPGVIPSAKWNTDEWKKKSKAAMENRNKTDSSGCTARHTGGSIGYEEHRLKLVNLTAESKKKYFEGDKEVPLDCATETAREAAEAYNRGFFENYGEDPAQHMVNDPELWTQTQLRRQGGKQKGPMFGIGSSDLNYLVTGTYSSESSSSSVAATDYAKSQADYAKSQEKVIKLEQQLVNMQQSMDESQNAMTSEMEQMKKMREDMAAFMREFRSPVQLVTD
ncbi:hypothetical protein LXL04_016209 [Taraxacum kok-saghyz]